MCSIAIIITGVFSLLLVTFEKKSTTTPTLIAVAHNEIVCFQLIQLIFCSLYYGSVLPVCPVSLELLDAHYAPTSRIQNSCS